MLLLVLVKLRGLQVHLRRELEFRLPVVRPLAHQPHRATLRIGRLHRAGQVFLEELLTPQLLLAQVCDLIDQPLNPSVIPSALPMPTV